MKTSLPIPSFTFAIFLAALAPLPAAAAPAEPQIVERGPHHRVWERTIAETLPDGTTAERKSSYIELATGLHYQNERGEWLDSKEEIEIFQGAAAARQGPHQVIFAANLNSQDAIDLLSPDGKRFRSTVLGLAYTDYASGRSVMIAEVKDCTGAVLPPNQVIYQDAFAGDCLADVRYTYMLAGFEQDVLILTAPPAPEAYGLDPVTTRLEVWTEFIEIPEGTRMPVVLKQEADPATRQRMVEPDLIDQRLDFGVMKFEAGHAFPLDAGDPFGGASVATGKSLERIDGRVFLIEKVDYPDIREHLQTLPQHAAAEAPRRSRGNETQIAASGVKAGSPSPQPSPPGEGARGTPQAATRSGAASVADANAAGSVATTTTVGTPPLRGERDGVRAGQSRALLARSLPAPKGTRGQWKERQYAKLEPKRKGLVLDYITLNGSLTNFVFKGDTTYYPTNTVNLYGTTILEGGTVIKGAGIAFRGPLDCRTSAYRPATWTAKDDDSIGEVIAGSTGSPSGTYGNLLNLYDTSAICDLHDFRMFYAYLGITLNAGTKADLSHFQIGKSRSGIGQISGTSATCRNFLLYDLSVLAFQLTGAVTNRSEHGTLHRVANYRQSTNASSPFTLTNSLLIGVSNYVLFTGANNILTYTDDPSFFQTVGASGHYLASGSTNRNAGTTNINPTLLEALKKKTTYSPIVLSNAITTDTTLTAQAGRDTDVPDLGYHLDPLDYVASQIAVTNATLTLQAGTALGVYGASSAPGLVVLDGGKIISEGAPDNLNRIVRYNLVQEQATTTWGTNSVGRSITTVSPYGTNLLASQASFRFTDFSMPASGNDHLYAGATNLTFTVQDCQFHGGSFTAVQPDVTLLNNLFERAAFKLYANVNPFTALVRNVTFAGGTVTVSNVAGGTWTFTDNLFDTTNLLHQGVITHNYNAYLTNSARLTNNGANDVLLTVTNIAYDTGWLGRFYLPTNLTSHSVLFNSGSQNATTAGLYHFTCVTNQTRELNTTVDLGFHSVAVNSSGAPLDTDGDGLADYYEDTDGDGSYETGETDWQTYNSLNGLTGSPGLQVFTPLK